MDTQVATEKARSRGGVAVRAEGFGLKGPRGWAFREVTIDAGPGSLIAIEGPSGSGRTCLLLALTGRMRPAEGSASVGRLRLPKQMAAVRRISALGHAPGVSDLEPALTVAEHLRERALLQRRFGGSLRGLLRPRGERRSEARLRVERALDAAGLDPKTLPKGTRTAVRDLERTEALRLSIALALIGEPKLLGVDDTDLKLSDDERAEIWRLLTSLADGGRTVVAVCTEAPANAVVVSTAAAKTDRDTADADSTSPDTADATDTTGTTDDAGTTDATSTTDATRTTDSTDDDTDTAAEATAGSGRGNGDALAETGRA